MEAGVAAPRQRTSHSRTGTPDIELIGRMTAPPAEKPVVGSTDRAEEDCSSSEVEVKLDPAEAAWHSYLAVVQASLGLDAPLEVNENASVSRGDGGPEGGDRPAIMFASLTKGWVEHAAVVVAEVPEIGLSTLSANVVVGHVVHRAIDDFVALQQRDQRAVQACWLEAMGTALGRYRVEIDGGMRPGGGRKVAGENDDGEAESRLEARLSDHVHALADKLSTFVFAEDDRPRPPILDHMQLAHNRWLSDFVGAYLEAVVVERSRPPPMASSGLGCQACCSIM